MKTLREVIERKYPDGTKISSKLPSKYGQAKGNQNCANCGYYVAATKHCKRWDARVRPTYWCAKWEPKSHAGEHHK